MDNTDLILHDNENINKLLISTTLRMFMSDAVEEILITTDPNALILELSSEVGDIDWGVLVELGKKNIVVDLGWGEYDLFDYKKITAIIVRWHHADDVETFISKNRKLILKR